MRGLKTIVEYSVTDEGAGDHLTLPQWGHHPILVALDMTMAFDKCRFDILFKKIESKRPPSVVQVLIFAYQRQCAWVRWGDKKSTEFGIFNGTRQGSVLSPALFTVYVQ